MEKLTKDKIDRLREGFKNNAFFLFASSAYDALHPLCGDDLRYMESEAQLFYDASLLLDHVISSNGFDARRLWTDLRADYHRAIAIESKSINKEIAMLVYVVAYAVVKVPGLKGMIGLSEELLNLIEKYLDDDVSLKFTFAMHKASKEQNDDLDAWLNDCSSVNALTQQIQDVLKPRKAKPPKPKATPPNTLCYTCHDDTRCKRIDQLRRVWESFGWIGRDMDIDDFERFFNGGNHDCHINWINTANLLTLLMRQLFESGLFKKQDNCSAKNIVMNQFKKTPNYTFDCISEEKHRLIKLSIRILDYKLPMLTPSSSHEESHEEDAITWQNAISENLHITK